MGNFRPDKRVFGDRGNSRGGFGGRSRGGFRDRDSGFDRRRPEMHEVTCDKCGKQCEVPFKPTGDKPVFCSDCFRKEDSGSRRNSSSSDSSQGGISQEQYRELNTKLDKILGILEMIEFEEEGDEDSEEEVE